MHFQMRHCIFFVVLFLSVQDAYPRLCQVNKEHGKVGDHGASTAVTTEHPFLYSCPKAGDPPHLTECCDSNIQNECCERKNTNEFITGLDDRLLIIISIGVIIACLLSTMLILICCFWSKCPMYSTCRSKYQHNEAIAFSTKEEMMKLNGMPNEDYNLHQQLLDTSNTIKVRHVGDEA